MLSFTLTNIYTPRVILQNEPKRHVFVKLPFSGSTSFQTRKKLFTDKLTSCNLKHVFTSPITVESFFILKDKLNKILLPGNNL